MPQKFCHGCLLWLEMLLKNWASGRGQVAMPSFRGDIVTTTAIKDKKKKRISNTSILTTLICGCG